MDPIKCMRCIGYENNKVGIQSLARDYTVSLRKSIKSKDSSIGPYSAIDGFLCRLWYLKISKSQSLAINRKVSASREKIKTSAIKTSHTLPTKQYP